MDESGRQALVEVARSGMERTTEGFWVGVEAVTEPLGHQSADVDDVHPRTGYEFQFELDRR
jgi:hypothetical protein